MKTLSKVLFASLILLSSVGRSFAAPSETGVLSQVSGKVEVGGLASKTPKTAKDGTKVRESEKVTTGADSKTMVRFFDGSQLAISPNSSVQMGKIRKLSDQDKVLHFKLLVGKLMASVQKLASSKSSFEIEAGGVVCGVRGTEYSLEYDPNTGKVDVQVLEGTVWVQSGNNTFTYGAGQGGSFTNGNPDSGGNNGGGNGSNGNTGNGNQGKGGNDFSPFYGFNGNGGDDPGGSLTNLDGGVGQVTGQTGDNGRNDAGNPGVVIELSFPQYIPPSVPPVPPHPVGGGGGGGTIGGHS
jgi:hypothetical protein